MAVTTRSSGGTGSAVGGFHSVPLLAGMLLGRGMAARRRRTGSGPGARAGRRVGIVVTLALLVALIVLVKVGAITQPAVVMIAFVPTNVVGLGLLAVYRTPRPAAVGEVARRPSTAAYAPLPGSENPAD